MNDGLGLWLRRTRETQQLTLDDVEKALRVRRRYLQALEVGDYAALPGEIQARGFLRNYARFLNLPAEEALARYDAEIRGLPMQPRTRASASESVSAIPERPSVFSPPPSQEEEAVAAASGDIPPVVIALLVALLFFAFIAIGSFIWLQLVDRSETQDTPPQSAGVATILPSPQLTVLATSSFVPAVDGKVQLRLVANEHAWVNISADENIIFQGVAEPNQSFEAVANELLIIATGNGGAFQLYINGTDWGQLGNGGEVVRRAWAPSGEVNLEGP